MVDRKKELLKLEKEVTNLTTSPLYSYRKENNYVPVFGEGSPKAKIMFVGEAPGKNEAMSGKPFCGSAGKILDKLLESINVGREEVYITSIVKDRPPKNRDPKPEEISVYAPFLDKQIEIIKPKVVVTLGRYAMEYVMKRYGLADELRPISELHGKVFITPDFKIVALYHPAAAIYNRKLTEALRLDFQILNTVL